MEQIWDILQIEPTNNIREIKRAYARCSKEIHPEEKPEEFQNLYEAYQRALQYASYTVRSRQRETETAETAGEELQDTPDRGENEETEAAGTVRRAGAVSASKEDNHYEALGLYSEEMQKEWAHVAELGYFQNFWNRQIFEQERGRGFLSEEWKKYLQSEKFKAIMMSPLVLETVAAGMAKYFRWKKDVLLFFWELYEFDLYEKWDEGSFNREGVESGSLKRLYESLYSVCERDMEAERIRNINFFLESWEKQLLVWNNGGGYLDEAWKEYLKSEKFRDIMWSMPVLNVMVAGLSKVFPRREEAALLFWERYGFKEGEEQRYEGKGQQLYRILYWVYINYRKRQLYGENGGNIEKQKIVWETEDTESERMRKILAVGAGVIFGILGLVMTLAYCNMLGGVLGVVMLIVVAIAVVLLFKYMAEH